MRLHERSDRHQYFGASLEVVYKKTYVCVK